MENEDNAPKKLEALKYIENILLNAAYLAIAQTVNLVVLQVQLISLILQKPYKSIVSNLYESYILGIQNYLEISTLNIYIFTKIILYTQC